MAKQNLISKKYEVIEGNMKIVETVEKFLSPDELMREKQAYEQRQTQIIQQMVSLKAQYDELDNVIDELSDMINSFPEGVAVPATSMPPIPTPRLIK